jgi:hypothetical protein
MRTIDSYVNAMNLTINCSSDRLQIWIQELYFEIPNRWLEIEFPWQLIQWIQEHHITGIYVINWPGSFTTLRVVCLTINLYVSTHPGQIKLWHCTKTDLYDKLLPSLGLTQIAIYIGQRNNMRLYDLTTKTHSIVAKSDIDPNIPYDDVSDEYAGDHQCVRISLDVLPQVMTQVDILHPHYLMEPNISSKS